MGGRVSVGRLGQTVERAPAARAEPVILTLFIIGLLLVTSLPALFAFRSAPTDRQFTGIVLNVADVERSLAFYIDVLGLPSERLDEFRRGEVGFPSVRINEGTLIDLQRDESRPEAAKLNLNHFCLVTEPVDLEALASELEGQGVRFAPGGIRKGAAGFDICFLHPKANEAFPIAGEGVLVELVQAPAEVVKAFAALA